MTRIAFVGKGGSGKTTLSSLFSRFLAAQHCNVLALAPSFRPSLVTDF